MNQSEFTLKGKSSLALDFEYTISHTLPSHIYSHLCMFIYLFIYFKFKKLPVCFAVGTGMQLGLFYP